MLKNTFIWFQLKMSLTVLMYVHAPHFTTLLKLHWLGGSMIILIYQQPKCFIISMSAICTRISNLLGLIQGQMVFTTGSSTDYYDGP